MIDSQTKLDKEKKNKHISRTRTEFEVSVSENFLTDSFDLSFVHF